MTSEAEAFESAAEQSDFGILSQVRPQLEPGIEGDQAVFAGAHFEGQTGEARMHFGAGGIGVSGAFVLNLGCIEVALEPESVSGLGQQLTDRGIRGSRRRGGIQAFRGHDG